MKILCVSHLYHPSIGGNQIHNQKIAEKLSQLGHEVTVFTSNAKNLNQLYINNYDLLPESEIINGVYVKRFKPNHFLHSLFFKKLNKMRGGYRFGKMIFGKNQELSEYGPIILSFKRAVIRHKPDIIIAINICSNLTHYCLEAKKILNIPVIMIPTAHVLSESINHSMSGQMLKESDLIIALTEFEKQYFLKRYIDKNKIRVIGIGSDDLNLNKEVGNQFKRNYKIEQMHVVSFVGRKIAEKGIDSLILAMRELWLKRDDVVLVIAGENDSNYAKKLASIINNLSPQDQKRIISIDKFDAKDKGGIFMASDIIIMPSKVDSFGFVYLEAWSCKKPVIACRDTAQESIIDDGRDGLLVTYGNSEELARNIERLLKDKDLRNMMGKNGRQKVETHYNWHNIVQSINIECKHLLGFQKERMR